MPNQYISISEAVILTGRSDATIRRAIKGMTAAEKKQHIKTVKGKIFVSTAFLEIEQQETTATTGPPQNEDLTFLKGQIEVKDKQIDNLNERLRETNILLRNEQETVNYLKTTLQLSEAKQEQAVGSDKTPFFNAYIVPMLIFVILVILIVIVYNLTK